MTDKELLEYAAKAVGIAAWFPRMNGGKNVDGSRIILTPCWYTLKGQTVEWQPLTDDGDALRLAVKLGISGRESVRICIEYQSDGEQDYTVVEHKGETVQYHLNDPYAATRRAIVRAAAEIGKAMP